MNLEKFQNRSIIQLAKERAEYKIKAEKYEYLYEQQKGILNAIKLRFFKAEGQA